MNMKNVAQLVQETKVVAIVRGLDSGYEQLAQALYDGGIRAIEVTFNQKDPSTWVQTTGAIHAIRETMGEKMAVGAGTVTTVELVQLAFDAGAEFIVSPDTNEAVIRRTKKLGMVSMPGAMTPTEIRQAYAAGADFVKAFPAGTLGSAYIKAIRGPLNNIPLLAVGAVLTQVDVQVVWRYFSWSNQTLAMIVLWTASMYLFREKKNYWITAVPATFMSAVSMTYFFCADECLGFSTAVAYPVGIILAALFLGIFIWATRKPAKKQA